MVVGIAKEHGHEFTEEHMNELSEEELGGVVGEVEMPPFGRLCDFNAVSPKAPAFCRGFLFLQYSTQTLHSGANTWHV